MKSVVENEMAGYNEMQASELGINLEKTLLKIIQLSNLNKAIVNSIGITLITTDKRGLITGFNNEAEKLLGYSKKDVLRKISPLSFFKEEESANVADMPLSDSNSGKISVQKVLSRIAEKLHEKHDEWILKRKDGSEVDVLLSVNKIQNSTEVVEGYLIIAWDNTLRKKAEADLKKSEQNFFRLFNQHSSAMLLIDPENSNIIEANEAAKKFYGYSFDKTRIWNVADICTKDQKIIEDNIRLALTWKEEVIVTDHRTQSGETRTVEINCTPIAFDDRQVIFGIINDITERTITESYLKMLNNAFNAFALTILITDIDGNILWANPAFSKLTGYTSEEVKYKNVSLLNSGEMSKGYFKQLWNTILSGNVWESEIINKRKDGTKYYEEETITPIFNNEGKIHQFIAIKIDITHRKELEQELKTNEARLKAALDGSGDGIWDYNVVTGEVFFSERWKNMLGYKDTEISNKIEEWTDRVHPDDLQRCLHELDNHISGKSKIYSTEHRLRCKNGLYKWILDRGKIAEWDKNGKPFKVIGTHTDIDSKKKLEKSLKINLQKEKELHDMKSKFLSVASHEFRTPLASLLITTDSLTTYWNRLKEPEINHKLAKINTNVLQLTDIVNKVLQLSKIEDGKIDYSPESINLIELCSQITESFNTDLALNKTVKMICPYKSIVMHLDHRLITQSINNLVENGLKYSFENSIIELKLAIEKKIIKISISDKGIGIPESEQDNIFTPFIRGSNARSIQGTGLGLSIVKESVQVMGGRITFISKPGFGTTFTIHFPHKLLIGAEQ